MSKQKTTKPKKNRNKQNPEPTERRIYPSPRLLVTEFHEAFGHPVNTEYTLNRDVLFLRQKLILEEASELYEAEKENDLLEIADALADLVYVTYGAAIAVGIDLDDAFGGTDYTPAEVLRVVFTKLGKKIRTKPTLNVIGRKGITQGINATAVKFSRLILENELENIDREDLRTLLVSLISSCYFAAFRFGIPLDEVLEIVHPANMSKLGEDGKPITREDGKTLKGPNFYEPQPLIQELLDSRA